MSTTSTESDAIVVADPMTGKDTLTADHGAVESNPATVARQFSLGSLEPTPQPDSHSKSRTKLLVSRRDRSSVGYAGPFSPATHNRDQDTLNQSAGQSFCTGAPVRRVSDNTDRTSVEGWP